MALGRNAFANAGEAGKSDVAMEAGFGCLRLALAWLFSGGAFSTGVAENVVDEMVSMEDCMVLSPGR
jgi:hypothetical protein